MFTTPDIIEKLNKSEDTLLTDNEIKTFRFVIIENKFLTEISTEQLEKKSVKLQKGITILPSQKRIKATEKNTTCYLLTTDTSKQFKAAPGWNKKSYVAYIEELYKLLAVLEPKTQKHEDDIFIRKYIENYVDLLQAKSTLYFHYDKSKI